MTKSQIEGGNCCGIRPKFIAFCRNHSWSIVGAVLISAVAFVFYCNAPATDSSIFSRLQNCLLNIIGPIALVYVFHSLKICICRPIKRDWLLSQGLYIWRVIGFVVAVPIALSLIISVATYLPCVHFKPSDMMYSSDMYGDYEGKDEPCMVEEYEAEAHQPSMLWTVFYHFIDPGNQHSTLSLSGRVFAGICAALGVLLLNGLLVSVLVGMFDSKREKWRDGTARYQKYLRKKDVYVIIGGGEIDVRIVRSIFDKVHDTPNRCFFARDISYPYILIQTSANVEELRANIYAELTNDSKRRHVVIYSGSRTSQNDIAELGLSRAKLLYIFGEIKLEESQESMHDAYNMRCLEIVADYLKENPRQDGDKLCTYLMFEHQTTFSIYQFSEISDRVSSSLEFRPINFYELWAQQVLICKDVCLSEPEPKQEANSEVEPEQKQRIKPMPKPLEGEGIDMDSDDFVHLVIFGMSRMGIALAIEAAHLAHYPNFVTKKIRTRITFIDDNMEQERNFFMSRFKGMFELARHRYVVASPSAVNIYSNEECGEWVNPMNDMSSDGRRKYAHLGNDFIDIEWEFVDGTMENPVIHKYLEDAANNPHAKLTIAMCHADLNQAAAAAIYMPREVYYSDRLQQVLVYQRFDDSLFSQLSTDKCMMPFNHKVVPFGKISETCAPEWLDAQYEMATDVQAIYQTTANDNDADKNECELESIVRNGKREWTKPYKKAIDDAKQSIPDKDYDRGGDVETLKAKYPNKSNKSKIAGMWSNIYNANMVWTKLRCLKKEVLPLLGREDGMDEQEIDLKDEQMWIMAYVEHNRWNVEQLLMTYKPLSYDEYCIWQTDKRNNGDDDLIDAAGKKIPSVRNIYKALMKHPDICSCDMIHNIDDTFKYDMEFSENLKRFYDMYSGCKLTKQDNEESRNS